MAYKSSKIDKNNSFRFIFEDLNMQSIKKDKTVTLPFKHPIAQQLYKVLRAKAGDKVILINKIYTNDETKPIEAIFKIIEIRNNSINLGLLNIRENDNEPDKNVSLFLCLPNKPQKLELIVQKAVELGVYQINLIRSQYSQYKHQLKESRLQKIIEEAVEQSERSKIPIINIESENLIDYLKKKQDHSKTYVAIARRDIPSVKTLIPFPEANLLIGPEGGFSPAEMDMISKNKLNQYSLGKRILRTETAAILSLGIATL
ncbi:RsmE family RNA methyltransferase [Candidatus Peregrinibacteria bacterium]|nr:RsmE family RNA methyltransferase [Candidatus Peregrinibacteria bacterium]